MIKYQLPWNRYIKHIICFYCTTAPAMNARKHVTFVKSLGVSTDPVIEPKKSDRADTDCCNGHMVISAIAQQFVTV